MTGIPSRQLDGISLRVDVADVQKAIRLVPRAAYFWLRAYMFQLAKEHRTQWLKNKGTRFGRVSNSGRGIIVSRVNEGQNPPRDNEVAYVVSPREERQPTVQAATDAIPQLRIDIFTGNKILPVHEFGIDISSAGWMAVPVKTRPGNIHRWRERNPGAVLITLPSKRGDDKRLVYEVTLRRARGRLRKDWIGPAPVREKLRLRWVLTKTVDMKPTLKLYATWDNIQSAQDELWQRYADRMMEDIARGIET